MHSVVLSSNNPDIVCTGASSPLRAPPQVCIGPVAFCVSPLKFCINAAVTILLNISPIPTGRIPGFLSSPIILHDRKGRIGALSVFVVASLRVNLARAPHKSLHRFPKLLEHRIFLPLVHSSDLVRRLRYTSGPLLLCIRRLALHIDSPGLAQQAGVFFQLVDIF